MQYYTLSEWRKNRKSEIEAAKPVLTDDELWIRNKELEREISELQRANDILKDALGFFGFNLLKLKTRKK